MKTLASLTLTLLMALCITVTATSQENSNSNSTTNANNSNANNTNTNGTTNTNSTSNSNRRRGPIFRATRDQITQAQAILRQRGFLEGAATEGRLDDPTRAGLRRYQQAETLRVTGTLNRVTLEKMNITLTERQLAMPN